MKFNRKYVGHIRHTKQGEVCVVVFGGWSTYRWRPCRAWTEQVGVAFSLSEKSERELPASERENCWWVAYWSITRYIQFQENRVAIPSVQLAYWTEHWDGFDPQLIIAVSNMSMMLHWKYGSWVLIKGTCNIGSRGNLLTYQRGSKCLSKVAVSFRRYCIQYQQHQQNVLNFELSTCRKHTIAGLFRRWRKWLWQLTLQSAISLVICTM